MARVATLAAPVTLYSEKRGKDEQGGLGRSAVFYILCLVDYTDVTHALIPTKGYVEREKAMNKGTDTITRSHRQQRERSDCQDTHSEHMSDITKITVKSERQVAACKTALKTSSELTSHSLKDTGISIKLGPDRRV